MLKPAEIKQSESVAHAITGIRELKGKEIVWLNMNGVLNAMCDHFIICHGTSNTHVRSIADSVEKFIFLNCNEKPRHKEGFENCQWILLDYSDLVVHVFLEEPRRFYNLEDLWSDAELTQFNE